MSTPSVSIPSVSVSRHGVTPAGEEVRLFTLTNARGHVVSVSEYGAMIVDLRVPDRTGALADISLGYPTLAGYFSPGNPYFGTIVGRWGGRIAEGRFTLDGKTYSLVQNDGTNHLHGGKRGFDKLVWCGEAVGNTGVRFNVLSADGDEGYPGNLRATLTYTWSDADELRLEFVSTSDKPTPVNLTNHVYLNLSGQHGTTVTDHVVTIPSERYVELNKICIATGKLAPVAGTPLDFRTPRALGERIRDVGNVPVGYDFTFVVEGSGLRPAAEVVHPASGRRLRVSTTEPGVHLYTGNFLNGSERGKDGATYPQYGGFCLETQHYPDSPNHPHFPNVILRPGEERRSTTVFAFGV
jgi:aldose 1-epimerase